MAAGARGFANLGNRRRPNDQEDPPDTRAHQVAFRDIVDEEDEGGHQHPYCEVGFRAVDDRTNAIDHGQNDLQAKKGEADDSQFQESVQPAVMSVRGRSIRRYPR